MLYSRLNEATLGMKKASTGDSCPTIPGQWQLTLNIFLSLVYYNNQFLYPVKEKVLTEEYCHVMIYEVYQKAFPKLVIDEEYILREQSDEDTKPFFEYYCNDPDVTRYILAAVPLTPEEANAEIQYCRNLFYHKRGIYWTLARQSDNQIIGSVGLYMNNHHHRAEICYDLAKAYWRKGIMERVLNKAIDFAFEKLAVYRIEALTLKENAASIGILQKIGFVREGTLRKYRYFKDAPRDVELFATTIELIQAKRRGETDGAQQKA